ncbi:MAG: phosphatidate cytidylyltransferase, partial [Candidatus Delongbacteria bacterium]|nr:phosphatidate cytidylyltransferase [Candidatus Delongbacteria bacterium]
MNNMLVRTIIALIAAPVILYSPFLGINYFTSFIFIISFLGSKEIFNFYKIKHIGLNKLSPYLISLLPIIYLSKGFETMMEYTIVLSFALFFFEVFRAKEKVSFIISGYLLMIIYCGIFPSMLIGVVNYTIPLMFIFIYGIIIATDSFAYFGGLTCSKLFRTHKLL